MTTKGNPFIKVRIEPETRERAAAAFPAERGKPSGLSAEVKGFVAFLAEHPQDWAVIKQAAAGRGVEPWEMIRDSFRTPED